MTAGRDTVRCRNCSRSIERGPGGWTHVREERFAAVWCRRAPESVMRKARLRQTFTWSDDRPLPLSEKTARPPLAYEEDR